MILDSATSYPTLEGTATATAVPPEPRNPCSRELGNIATALYLSGALLHQQYTAGNSTWLHASRPAISLWDCNCPRPQKCQFGQFGHEELASQRPRYCQTKSSQHCDSPILGRFLVREIDPRPVGLTTESLRLESLLELASLHGNRPVATKTDGSLSSSRYTRILPQFVSIISDFL